MTITVFNENGGVDCIENRITFAEGVYHVDSEWTFREFDTIDQVIEYFRVINNGVNDFGDIGYVDINEVNKLRDVDVAKLIEEAEHYDEEDGVEVGTVTLMYKLPLDVTFEVKEQCVDFNVVDECGTTVVEGKANTIKDCCDEICDVLNTKHCLGKKFGEWFNLTEDMVEEFDDNVYVCNL